VRLHRRALPALSTRRLRIAAPHNTIQHNTRAVASATPICDVLSAAAITSACYRKTVTVCVVHEHNAAHLAAGRVWRPTTGRCLLLLLLRQLLHQLLHCGHLFRVKVPGCRRVDGHTHLACLGVHTERRLQQPPAPAEAEASA
jgi:hypothetical protein